MSAAKQKKVRERKSVETKLKHQITVIAEDVLRQAKAMGATAAEVNIAQGGGITVQVRNGQPESVEQSKGKTVGITVYFGHRIGNAISSDLSDEAIKLSLNKACHIARFTSEDPFVRLADPELMAYDYPDLDLYHPYDLDVNKAIALAQECEAIGLNCDRRITSSEGAAVEAAQTFALYANSHGFIGTQDATRYHLSCSLIAGTGDKRQRDGYYSVAHDYRDLKSAEKVAKMAAKRAARRLDPRSLTTRKCPVIFVSEVAKDIIDHFLAAVSGGSLYRKASFLLDSLHRPVMAKHLSIEECPHLPKALGSAPFDSEGVRNNRSFIVAQGILARYILDSYSARKLNMKTTGNAGGVHNAVVKSAAKSRPGGYSLPALLKLMDTGLLVMELMGDAVNIITGDYSQGAFGFWVERGEIQYPVDGITIAGNLRDMLMDIVAIGNDVDKTGGIHMGSVLLEKMMVAGK